MDQPATGYRVRVECSDFFAIDDGGERRDEIFTLAGAIQAAEDFIADTEDATSSGTLQCAYVAAELEIVTPRGEVLSIETAKALLATEVPVPNSAEFTLERFATGRFDVRKDGLRLGSVIGGRRTWCAEIGNRVLGYFPSPRKAGAAIVAERQKTT